jgi:hypothetical protein
VASYTQSSTRRAAQLESTPSQSDQETHIQQAQAKSKAGPSARALSTLDQVRDVRAEVSVLSEEIEINLVKAAIKAVEDDKAALTKCFDMSVKEIEAHIHPFQQFAATCYFQVDPASHLDMVTKMSEVQKFVTKLRNRGTEVATLTSGPGMVFTIKDFNECLQALCRSLIKYGERELRSRSELSVKKEQALMEKVYG